MPLRVRTAWTGEGAQGGGVTTMTFIGEDQTTASAAAAAAVTFWTNSEAVIDAGTTWTVENEVDQFNVLTGQTTGTFSVTGGTGNGNSVGEVLPIATQGLIRWRTGVFVGGREIRGRTFIPGIGEPFLSTDGRPTTAFLTTLQSTAGALIADANSQLAIYSPTHDLAPVVTLSSVWNNFAVLRSRRD